MFYIYFNGLNHVILPKQQSLPNSNPNERITPTLSTIGSCIRYYFWIIDYWIIYHGIDIPVQVCIHFVCVTFQHRYESHHDPVSFCSVRTIFSCDNQLTGIANSGRIPLGYPSASRRPTIDRRPMERVRAARGSPAGGRKAPGSKARVRSVCA